MIVLTEVRVYGKGSCWDMEISDFHVSKLESKVIKSQRTDRLCHSHCIALSSIWRTQPNFRCEICISVGKSSLQRHTSSSWVKVRTCSANRMIRRTAVQSLQLCNIRLTYGWDFGLESLAAKFRQISSILILFSHLSMMRLHRTHPIRRHSAIYTWCIANIPGNCVITSQRALCTAFCHARTEAHNWAYQSLVGAIEHVTLPGWRFFV